MSEDIRKTGEQNYKQLQQENQVRDVNYYANRFNSINAATSMYNPYRNAEQDFQSPALKASLSQGNTDNYFGSSMFDPEELRMDDLSNLQDIRAENQPWIAKTGAALTKFAAKTGTTFVDSLLNVFVGGATGIYKGLSNTLDDNKDTDFWSGFKEGLWNNQLNTAITEIDEQLEKALPEYYTEADMNAPWYNHSGMYVFNNLLKNAGFTVGAAAAMLVTGGTGLPNVLNRVLSFSGKAAKFGDWATKFSMGLLSATGEASIEAANAYKDGMNQIGGNIKYQRDIAIEAAQQEYQNNIANGMDESIAATIYQQKINQAESISNQLLAQADTEMKQAASTTMMLNYPILTISNMLQFGKLLTGGYKINKTLADIFKNTRKTIGGNVVSDTEFAERSLLHNTNAAIENTLKKATVKDYIKGGTKAFFSEGSEEASQKLASETPMLQAKAKINSYAKEVIDKYPGSLFAHQINPDAGEDMMDFSTALGETIQRNFGSIDAPGWEEFMLGAVMGVLGIPMLGKRKSGKWGLVWEGGAKEAAQEINEEYDRVQNVVDIVNRAMYSNEYKDRLMKGIGSISMEDYMNQSVEDENILTFKNSETLQLVQYVLFAQTYGQLDSLKSFYEGLSRGVSDEDVAAIKTLLPEGVRGMTDDDIKKEWQGKAQRTLDKISSILDIAKKAEAGELGDFYSKLTTTAKNEYIAMASLVENLQKRKSQLEEEKSRISGTTEFDKKNIETIDRGIKSIDSYINTLDTLIKKTHNDPTFLNDRIAEIQGKAVAYQISKDAEAQKQQYQAAETVEDIATIYFAADEATREATFQEAKKDASPEVKALMDKFESFQGDIQAVTNYIEQMVDAKNISDDEKDAMKDNYMGLLYNYVIPRLMNSRYNSDRGGIKSILIEQINDIQRKIDRIAGFDTLKKAKDEIIDELNKKIAAYGMKVNLNNPSSPITGGTPEQQKEVIELIGKSLLLKSEEVSKQELINIAKDLKDIHNKLDTLASVRKSGNSSNPRAKKKPAPVAPPAPSSTTTGQATGTNQGQGQLSAAGSSALSSYASLSKFKGLKANIGAKIDKELHSSAVDFASKVGGGNSDDIKESLKKVITDLHNGLNTTNDLLKTIDNLLSSLDKTIIDEVISWWESTYANKGASTAGFTTKPATTPLSADSNVSIIGDNLGHDRVELENHGVYKPYNSPNVEEFYRKFPDADKIRDTYLRKGDTVYYLRDENTPAGVIYLAVEYNNNMKINSSSIIELNGKKYVIFGTLGYYDTDPQEVKDDIEAQKTLITDNINSKGTTGLRVSDYTTEIKDITEGENVKQIGLSAPYTESKDLKDLLNNPIYNPYNLGLGDLMWGLTVGNEESGIKYEVLNQRQGTRPRNVETPVYPGQVYLYIPTQGMYNGSRIYIPVYIHPVMWNEWNNKECELYNTIIGAIKSLMTSTNQKDKVKRIATIRDFIMTTTANHFSYDETRDEIFFTIDGLAGSSSGINSIRFSDIEAGNISVQDAINTFIEFLNRTNLRVGVNKNILLASPRVYLDAGILRTTTTVLGTKGARPLLYPIDSRTGTVIVNKRGNTPQVNKLTPTIMYIDGKYYEYSPSTSMWLNEKEERIDDEMQNLLNIVTSKNTEKYEVKAGKTTIIYYEDLNTGKMFYKDENGRFNILTDAKKESVKNKATKAKKKEESANALSEAAYKSDLAEHRTHINADSKAQESKYSNELNTLKEFLNSVESPETFGYKYFLDKIEKIIDDFKNSSGKALYNEGFAVYYDQGSKEVFVYDTRPPVSTPAEESIENAIYKEAALFATMNPTATVGEILHHVRSHSNEWATFMLNNNRVERTIARYYGEVKIAATAVATSLEDDLENKKKNGTFEQLLDITPEGQPTSNLDKFIDTLEAAGYDVDSLESSEDVIKFIKEHEELKKQTDNIISQEQFDNLLNNIKDC